MVGVDRAAVAAGQVEFNLWGRSRHTVIIQYNDGVLHADAFSGVCMCWSVWNLPLLRIGGTVSTQIKSRYKLFYFVSNTVF